MDRFDGIDENEEDSLETDESFTPSESPQSPPITQRMKAHSTSFPPSSEPRRLYSHIESKDNLSFDPNSMAESPTPHTSINIPQSEPKERSRRPFWPITPTAVFTPTLHKTKSFSDADAYDSSKKEEIVSKTKTNCDAELKTFLDAISHELSEETHFMYVQIVKYANSFTNLTLEEIKEGHCKEIVDNVQKLQQTCFQRKLPGKHNVTKLLLIISRLSRLDVASEAKSSQKKLLLAKSGDFPSPSPTDFRRHSIAKERDSGTGLLDMLGRFKRQLSVTGATRRVELTAVDKLPTRKFAKDRKDFPETENKNKSKGDDHLLLLCRICEEFVAVHELEVHSKSCARESSQDMQVTGVDARLSQLLGTIDKRLAGTVPIPSPEALKSPLNALREIILRALTSTIDEDSSGNVLEKCEGELAALSLMLPSLSSEEAEMGAALMHSLQSRTLVTVQEKRKLWRLGEDVRLKRPKQSNAKGNSLKGEKPRLSDFKFLKPISRGAYGKVFLARKKRTGDVYAVKVMNKNHLRKKNQVEHIKAERTILAHVQHPFVVKLYYSFQTKENLYMVMEFISGGDLYSLLKSLVAFDLPMTLQYIAEITLALGYLHSKGIVHRDLKPDNLLIGQDGHIKLTDFGLSRVALYDQVSKSESDFGFLTGSRISPIPFDSPPSSPTPTVFTPKRRGSVRRTPDYLAPEVILGTGHGQSVDWWALGVLTFEFLTGIPPFNADSPHQIFENVLIADIPWEELPEDLPSTVRNFIERLLTVDPESRLGAQGAEEVKSHPFFQEIDWSTLLDRQPLFVPKLTDAEDTSYFDDGRKFEMEMDAEEESLPEDDFLNFSYKHLPNLEALTKNLMTTHSPSVSPLPTPRSHKEEE